MKYHFIAIGGAIMHQLAICLKQKGHSITGSDDVIYDPSKKVLDDAGLLPERFGWFPENITENLDGVILGMHARQGNAELERAQELGIPVYSFPEFFYNAVKGQKRIVITGSHGKTTITSMIMHVLNKMDIPFNRLVGAQLKGFVQMVTLNDDAEIVIIEGDEYLSSAVDRRPKFVHYKADVGVMNGIAWDHINVFTTYQDYKKQFSLFIDSMNTDSTLFFNATDEEVVDVVHNHKRKDVARDGYTVANYRVKGNGVVVEFEKEHFELKIFGKHNMNNLEAARKVCEHVGISGQDFFKALSDYTGASLRLEKLYEDERSVVIKDFAHAPSKVKASVAATRELYPHKDFYAFVELHTYSSLNPAFIGGYENSLALALQAFVYYDDHALTIKKMKPIDPAFVKQSFKTENVRVIIDSEVLETEMLKLLDKGGVFLFMSSGSWGKKNLPDKLSERFKNKR